jgi:two-component system sensor histidine kinase KdpD
MSCREFVRPNPDDLLRKLEEQDAQNARGRLKIFLGYAPRVGKSVRMFDEGRRRATRGQDVVVGSIQSKGIEGVQPFITSLEVIPSRVIDGEHVLDVDAILRRAPHVCLIDELARDNPPGSRHAHRWQDVEELVAAGITVLTALNLQYVAEQQDAIERITGRRARRSVPQSFIHSADEIVIVDVPAEGLVHNGGSGQLEAHQLSELRELALLLAAAVVEEQLLRYMKAHGIRQSWGTQERILVCIDSRSNPRPMLESGARAANRFHAQLFAVHVDEGELTRHAQETVDGYLDYARKLGAAVQVLKKPGDPIQAIISYAREHLITQVFTNRSQRSRWKFWARDPVECLIKAAEGMDVRIFPSTQPG